MTEPSDEKADKAPLTFEFFGLSGGIRFSQGLFFLCGICFAKHWSSVREDYFVGLLRETPVQQERVSLNHVNATGAYWDGLWGGQELASLKSTCGIFGAASASVGERTLDHKH